MKKLHHHELQLLRREIAEPALNTNSSTLTDIFTMALAVA